MKLICIFEFLNLATMFIARITMSGRKIPCKINHKIVVSALLFVRYI